MTESLVVSYDPMLGDPEPVVEPVVVKRVKSVKPVVEPVRSEPVVKSAGRGRIASPQTVTIRRMLEDSQGEITYSSAYPLLKELGYEVDQNSFNVVKFLWKKRQSNRVLVKKKTKLVLPEVSITNAFAYVSDFGSLTKAEDDLLRRIALVRAFRKFLKQTNKLTA